MGQTTCFTLRNVLIVRKDAHVFSRVSPPRDVAKLSTVNCPNMVYVALQTSTGRNCSNNSQQVITSSWL